MGSTRNFGGQMQGQTGFRPTLPQNPQVGDNFQPQNHYGGTMQDRLGQLRQLGGLGGMNMARHDMGGVQQTAPQDDLQARLAQQQAMLRKIRGF